MKELAGKLKNYTIIGLVAIIAVLLLLRQCGDSGTKTKEVFLKGTETIKWDTVKATNEIVKLKTVYYPKVDTMWRADTVWDASLCQYEREYNDSLSNDSITIYSKINTIGVLKSQGLSYKWKVPTINKTISRTDTLVRPNKWSLYGYSEIGGNATQFNASIGADLAVKRVIVGYRYEAIQKTHNVKVGFRLFKSKK